MNGGECEGERLDGLKEAGITWVVIGGYSVGKKTPPIEAIKEIVTACGKAGIPVWLKNNLFNALPFTDYPWAHQATDYYRGKPCSWVLRQEFPEVE